MKNNLPIIMVLSAAAAFIAHEAFLSETLLILVALGMAWRQLRAWQAARFLKMIESFRSQMTPSQINAAKQAVDAVLVKENIYQPLADYLVSSGRYNSLKEVDETIDQNCAVLNGLENSFGYSSSLYDESGEYKQKVYILMNAHFADFPDPLQQKIINLFG